MRTRMNTLSCKNLKCVETEKKIMFYNDVLFSERERLSQNSFANKR